jgi:hypothetical protein
VDPATALTILGGAVGSAKLIEKILGPTADYLGEGARTWTQRGILNLARIFSSARELLGNEIETDGAVPPRVLKQVLSEGAFCEDEIGAKYFGGILAASRSSERADDRGATVAQQIARLSTYQIRAHYLFYRSFRSVYLGSPLKAHSDSQAKVLQIYVPAVAFARATELPSDSAVSITDHPVADHVMFGLRREGLIGYTFTLGQQASLAKYYPEAPSEGFLLCPSALGAELYLWAHGKGSVPVARFLDPALVLSEMIDHAPLEGVLATGGCQCDECLKARGKYVKKKTKRNNKSAAPNQPLHRNR